ncbi:hypothetical protein Egran_05474 [Elaphomyces granulatus]|uniref:Formamidopyrimidine-DNA glycosylase catalytic domain-containing protein n=1 Tax=Elaphomyces granulatus TaxID=519963 RepID=A0A232LRK5_9EURO|nr:hypothetical protein Egran_05474 [Elaphomyces granulatus]
MPELAEVARIVHFIRELLVGKTLANVRAQKDDIVYGKAGTSAVEFQKAMQGKKVAGAGQQGKYFWIAMSSPPHVVMHFGMTGWLKIKNEDTYYNRAAEGESEEWPPKYWKFLWEADDYPKTEAAFVDSRRLSRIRLVDCPAEDIRKYSPLKENGPDPIADKEVLTEAWLSKKLRDRKVPIKALLLDQSNISGIGNWMGDEILYHSKIHPEQYCHTLADAQVKQLHYSLHYVCSTSVDLLGDSENFPEDWLFKYRWSKGKKNQVSALPNGDKVVFLTVGGRTSAVVPAVQKKTGPVTKEISDEVVDEGEEEELAESGNKRKRRVAPKNEGDADGDGPSSKKLAAKRDKGNVVNKSSNSQKPTKKEAPPNTTGKKSGIKRKDEDTQKGQSKAAPRVTRRSTRSTK